MAEITVKCKDGDYTVMVDEADFEWLSKKYWFDNQGYACTYSGPGKIVGMHRLIMGVTDPAVKVDHKHGNRRDYRRTELQILTGSQNYKKKHIPMEPTEEPGVFWSEFKRRYSVVLYGDPTRLYGGRYHAGDYKTIEKAVSVRDAEMKHGGFTTSRAPRSWDKLKTPVDAPESPGRP
jgi:hypothetical protein